MAVTTYSYYHSCVKKVKNSDGQQFHTTFNNMNNNLSPQISEHRKDLKGKTQKCTSFKHISVIPWESNLLVVGSRILWEERRPSDKVEHKNILWWYDRHCCISGCKAPRTNGFSRKWMFHIKILPRQNRYSSKINLRFGYKQKQNKKKKTVQSQW